MSWRVHIARYGAGGLPGEPWMRRTFLALLLLAAVLRFWDLPNLPYTHDELSAIIRLYPTLGETIQKGVIELDTHPPGVQVFEWIWARVFSKEEADMKLPFILMDLAALLLLYRFALAWSDAGPALVLTTLMATLQYSVLYGQIARPYAVGLFTTALLADQLTRYLAFGERRMLIGMGIAAVLSAYTHHFSLMLAALMVSTGLFMVGTKSRRAYLIMCAICAVLYVPNIPIFFKQLGQGGLSEWLQAPGADWLPRYAWFIANDSAALAAIMLFGVLASVVLTLRQGRLDTPMRWVLLIWGASPLVIGYAYSVWRAPVLQYSMLLFSLPYIVLFLVQGLVHLRKNAIMITCAISAFVAVKSLVHDRQHYDLFYHSKYEAMVREGVEAIKEHGKEGALVLLDAPDNVIGFYYDHWSLSRDEFPHVQLRSRFNAGQLDSILAATSAHTVVYGQSNGAPPEHVALIHQRFPNLVQRQDLVDGQVFRFTSQPVAAQWFDRDTIASLSLTRRAGPWQVNGDMQLIPDTAAGGAFWDYTSKEFGLGIELGLDSLVLDRHDQIEVMAAVQGWSAESKAAVIADVRSGDSTVFYRGGEIHARHRPANSDASAMIVSISPSDIKNDSLTLRAYVYNPSKTPLRVHRIDVLRRQANPVRYGTLEPVRWRGRFPAK